VKEERPDLSNTLSFPSGHTAIAFASAQFMFREYKDSNFLLAVSGYSLAVFTGVYRMLNNKHWFGDVVGGAGFGILSTELAYWLYPKINNLLGGKRENSSSMIMPYYQKGNVGIGFVKNF
jgi:membrane-associated phospholipid phosphatase